MGHFLGREIRKVAREIRISRRFRRHNLRVWGRQSGRSPSKVLVEVNSMRSSHIAYSYLANVLAGVRGGGEIVGIRPEAGWSGALRLSISNSLGRLWWLVHGTEGSIYRSFGAVGCTGPSIWSKLRFGVPAISFAHYWFKQARTKEDVERLDVAGVLVGDLIYDTFLRRRRVPTLDPTTLGFKLFLVSELAHFFFWQAYFSRQSVIGVMSSHAVYTLAFPLRIAAARGIPVFQATATSVHRITASRLMSYDEFKEFPKTFRSLPAEVRNAGVLEAQGRLERRFRGEVGVDMHYSSASAYTSSSLPKLLSESGKLKVLVATHCFFDSPHSYGFNAFPDYWEWLHFIGRFSEQVDHEFYLKTHPDYLPGNMDVLQHFLRAYPTFQLLPSDASHHQLIREGISVALTVYGTIGMEYAALGIPVINASINNPHVAYDFNFHARDRDQFWALLERLGELRGPGKKAKAQVAEYYFMKHIYPNPNLFLKDWHGTLGRLGGYHNQFRPKIFDAFLDEWDEDGHREIIAKMRHFVASDDYVMDGAYVS